MYRREGLHTCIYTTQRDPEGGKRTWTKKVTLSAEIKRDVVWRRKSWYLYSLSIPPPVPCRTCIYLSRCLESYGGLKGCIQGDVSDPEDKKKKSEWYVLRSISWCLHAQPIPLAVPHRLYDLPFGVISWTKGLHAGRYLTQRENG